MVCRRSDVVCSDQFQCIFGSNAAGGIGNKMLCRFVPNSIGTLRRDGGALRLNSSGGGVFPSCAPGNIR